MSNIPFQLTEQSFRRYEHVIASIVKSPDKTFTIETAPLSPQTYMARLRDAMSSHIQYRWESEVSPDQLATIRRGISVRLHTTDGFVVVGPKGRAAEVEQVGSLAQALSKQESSKYALEVSKPDLLVLHSLALLLSRKVLNGAIRIDAVEPGHITEITTRYNVAITQQMDGSYIML